MCHYSWQVNVMARSHGLGRKTCVKLLKYASQQYSSIVLLSNVKTAHCCVAVRGLNESDQAEKPYPNQFKLVPDRELNRENLGGFRRPNFICTSIFVRRSLSNTHLVMWLATIPGVYFIFPLFCCVSHAGIVTVT